MLLIDHYEELKQGCVSFLKAAKAVIINKAIFRIVFLTSELPPLILQPSPAPPPKTRRICTNLVSRSSRSLGVRSPGPPIAPSSAGPAVEDYYCAKFEVVPIRAFRFIVLTYPSHSHIYTHTHRDKVIAISVSPHYLLYKKQSYR